MPSVFQFLRGGESLALWLPLLERRKEPCPRLPLPLRGEGGLSIPERGVEGLALLLPLPERGGKSLAPAFFCLERRREPSYSREEERVLLSVFQFWRGGESLALWLPLPKRRKEPCPHLPRPLRGEGSLPIPERGGEGLALCLPIPEQEEERALTSGFFF